MKTSEILKKILDALKLEIPDLKLEAENSAALLISLNEINVLRMIGFQDESKIVKHIEVMYFPNKKASMVVPVFNNLAKQISSNDDDAPFKLSDQIHFEFGVYVKAKTQDDLIELLIKDEPKN